MGLKRVSALQEYEYPEYAYDVADWTVRTELDGSKVGKVDDLVVAPDGEPRYLDVDLGFLKKHVLLPLDRAHADPVDKVVIVERMSAEDFESVPPLTHDPDELTLDYERRLSEAYRIDARAERAEAAGVDVEDRFVRLGCMDGFRVRGDDDPRGWKVIAGDGVELGKAVDLLVDRDSLRAAYLLAAIDEKGHDLERIGRHVLIPIERVRLTEGKKVLVDGLFARDLPRYPVYGGLPVESSLLDRIGAFFERLIGTDAAAADVTVRGQVPSGPARHPRAFFGTSAPAPAPVDVDVDEDAARERDLPLTGRETVVDEALDRRPRVRARDERDAREVRYATDEVEGDAVTVRSGDREIRIQLRGDDIVIERQPAPEREVVEPPPA